MGNYRDIIFANGVRADCRSVLHDPSMDVIYIDFANTTLSDAAAICENPNATQTIQFGGQVYYGFTDFRMITVQPFGYQATLRRSQS